MVGGVVIAIFFGNAMATPDIYMSFGTLIPNLISKMSNSKKIDRMGHLKFLKLQWGTKTSNIEDFNKKGSYRVQMTRGFQIGFQIYIEQHFTPFRLKNGGKRGNSVFERFLAKKRVKYRSI